jgi:hypothetical protein
MWRIYTLFQPFNEGFGLRILTKSDATSADDDNTFRVFVRFFDTDQHD